MNFEKPVILCFQELGEVWNGLMQAVGASRKVSHNLHSFGPHIVTKPLFQVFEFIDRKPVVQANGKYRPDGNLQGKIEFKNVAFSYPIRPDLPIMEVKRFLSRSAE